MKPFDINVGIVGFTPGVNAGILSLVQIVPKRWRGADVKVVRVSEPDSDD
ncbi:DUF2080 family transposase-associated protein [Halonotius pteroides]|uniref:Uncharacterized protein n=1 Tax=Halonotius pteroides TaxID=268735 RepID=A0A3A6QAL3_9EURY|nr:DUF2080 family transposase-associated protein [Halonotius pteroides]RJX49982.1 hypothetical protein DP106_07565 [Halonotius pteroides]